ncbi:putative rna recognition domain-protein [Phialemonium atrogriseum]|uniref:Rna recognition domain-protein n=1 Tax=Phialemonium atrogriseum TaxID=1093897 RepID=A0AAJ0C6Q8_9PEZI|nr:putative rna recognition domain-protein [Phialemonium atrogriseum]KAK1770986.1 putative rna recognition domain-protein [Phialemonium atrogriseum]
MSIQHSEDPPRGGDAPSSPTASSKKRKVSLGEIEVDLTLPEPPSKKARRALKRGKSDSTNPPAAASADAAAEAAASKKAASKKKPTSAHGVWIGNLPFTATKADIRKWLIDNSGGSITDDAITRVYVPTTRPEADKKKKHDKKKPKKKGAEEVDEDEDDNDDDDDDEKSKTKAGNKGFAYVDFTTYATTVAAIALSETSLGGRKLLIKDSKNYEGRPARPEGDDAGKQPDVGKNGASAAGAGATTANGAPQSRSTKVFVGNLGFKASEDELWAHFEKCGPIRWVKVATFEDTGKCKGFAWVNFQEAEAAAWAVQGFVRIRQTVDTVEDFMDEEEGARGGSGGEAEQKEEDEEEEREEGQGVDGRGDVDGDGEKKKKQQARDRKGSKGEGPPQAPRKTKTRKWWVNQLHGRTLKIELAEDDKVRYKKRFGKGGAGAAAAAAKAQGSSRPAAGAAAGTSAPSEQQAVVGDGGSAKEQRAEKKEVDPLKVHHDINVARLTGAMVKSQGVKVTFD